MLQRTLVLLACLSCMVSCEKALDTDESGAFVEQWTIGFEVGLPQNWETGDWGFESNLCEFTSDMLFVEDSICKLQIAKKGSATAEYPDAPYWGAEVYNETDMHQYGRWAVRMKPSAPSGVVVSFFLANYQWNSDWSALVESSEIDIEFAGRTDQVELAIHYNDSTGKLVHVKPVPIITLPVDAGDDYHLWEIEVMPTHIRYYFDSTLIHEVTDSAVLKEMEHPLATRFNAWISDAPGWVGAFDEASLPVTTAYDRVSYSAWVRE